MVPVCSLNVYDAYSRDLAPRSVNAVKQNSNGCNGGYLDIIQELVALKSLQVCISTLPSSCRCALCE